ncbi:MAG TPA: hypothetical protein VD867_16190, partial [Burkholderiales bacterium]|nr:hypothetical protein [Burkholderiales bacterium]
AATPVYAVDPDYDVRLGDLTEPGELSTGLHAVYAPSGARIPQEGVRSGYHVLQLSPTFTWGLTRNTDIELQLYSSAGPRGEYRMGGAKVEVGWIPVRPAGELDGGYWLGAAVEVARLPRTASSNDLDSEVKAIVGLRRNGWTFAANPALQKKLAGPGGGGRPTLSLKATVAYQVNDTVGVGIEHYAQLGELGHLGPLNERAQHTFAVVDVRAKKWQVNFGVGRGLNDYSERWILKAVVGLPFGS